MMQMNSGNYHNNNHYNSEDSFFGAVLKLGVVGIGIASQFWCLPLSPKPYLRQWFP